MILRAYCLLIGLALASAAYAQPLDPDTHRAPRFELDGASIVLPGFQLAGAQSSRSYLGLAVIEIDEERAKDLRLPKPKGVEITNVVLNGPADKAGIEAGDALLVYAGEPVRGVEHLARLVRETPVGREVKIELWRSGKALDLMARVGERNVNPLDRSSQCAPGEECGEFRISRGDREIAQIQVPRPRIVMRSRALGAETEEIEGQFAKYFGVDKGVLVRTVESQSAAERAGLRAGDVILTVNKRGVETPVDVIYALRSAGAETEIPLGILREKRKLTLTLSLKQGRSQLTIPAMPSISRSVSRN